MRDQIHSTLLKRIGRRRKRLQEASRQLGGNLCSLADHTCLTVLFAVLTHLRPPKTRSKSRQHPKNTQVASKGVIMMFLQQCFATGSIIGNHYSNSTTTSIPAHQSIAKQETTFTLLGSSQPSLPLSIIGLLLCSTHHVHNVRRRWGSGTHSMQHTNLNHTTNISTSTSCKVT